MNLSWADAKLILLENGNKYPIRGTTYVPNYDNVQGNGVKNMGIEYGLAHDEFKFMPVGFRINFVVIKFINSKFY